MGTLISRRPDPRFARLCWAPASSVHFQACGPKKKYLFFGNDPATHAFNPKPAKRNPEIPKLSSRLQRKTPPRHSRLTGRVEGIEALLNEAQEEEDLRPASSRHLKMRTFRARDKDLSLGFLMCGMLEVQTSQTPLSVF